MITIFRDFMPSILPKLAYIRRMEIGNRCLSNLNCEIKYKFPKQVESLLRSFECSEDQKRCVKHELLKWRHKIDASISNTNIPESVRKHCVFVLGPMGVGKSTIIKTYLKSRKDYSTFPFVDTDEIMANLPNFSLDTITKHYPCARMVGILLTEWLFVDEISFIAEGTCVNWTKLLRFIQEMKDNGYTIEVMFPEKPLSVVLSQAKGRDRILPPETVADIYKKSLNGCLQLRLANDSHNPKLFKIVVVAE